MKKVDYNLLQQIKTGSYNWDSTKELYIKISKHNILVEFDYNRVKKTTKVNWFNNRLYHIPLQLIENFNSASYTLHQDKLRWLIQEQINTIVWQETIDWRDKLYVIKLQSDLDLIDRNVEDVIAEYILDRIYHKSLPEIYKYFEKDRARIVMISEQLQSTSLNFKHIIDTIIMDIYMNFEIKLALDHKKYSNTQLDKLLHDMWYSDNQIKNIWFYRKKDIKLLVNKQIEYDAMQMKNSFVIKEKR